MQAVERIKLVARLRRLIRLGKMTQGQFADLAGVARGTVSYLISRDQLPQAATAKKIASAFARIDKPRRRPAQGASKRKSKP